jgi:hypothetical protein
MIKIPFYVTGWLLGRCVIWPALSALDAGAGVLCYRRRHVR